MIRYLIPLILILIAIGVYFVGIQPVYEDVKKFSEMRNSLNRALSSSREIAARRDELLEVYNAVPEGNTRRLRQMIPDNVDNVRLILEMDSVAALHGMSLQDISIETDTRDGSGALGPDARAYGTIGLRMTLTGSYEEFLRFLEDVERGLRLVDVTELSFVANDSDFSQYEISVNTYWLR